MRHFILLLLVAFFSASAQAQSNSAVTSVQQKLKDQGFYYGEITGKKDADTTAAIRRYQIRNGLQITGDLNAETQKSLGVRGAGPAATPRLAPAAPRATPTPVPVAPPRAAPAEEEQDYGDDEFRDDAPVTPQPQRLPPGVTVPEEEEEFGAGPRALRPEMSGLFDDTPFAVAPPEVQQRVVLGAQEILARQGLYRSGIDGVYGPGTAFALRAHQARQGLEPTGRFDMETLASLGLLPSQQRRGFGAPQRRFIRPPRVILTPDGERVYQPRFR